MHGEDGSAVSPALRTNATTIRGGKCASFRQSHQRESVNSSASVPVSSAEGAYSVSMGKAATQLE